MPAFLQLWAARNAAVELFSFRVQVVSTEYLHPPSVLAPSQWYKRSALTDEEDYWTVSKLFDFTSILIVFLADAMFTIQLLEVSSSSSLLG